MMGKKEILWKEAPLSELLRLAWPICVSMLSYSVMTFADTAFVGHLGRAALAGVGLASMMGFAALVFGSGLLQGVKIVVSQAVGAGKSERVEELAGAGIIIALVLGGIVLIAGQLLLLVIPLALSEQAAIYGVEYLFIRLLTAPIFYLSATTRQINYGTGATKIPMVAALLANVVNIGLDYVFIVLWKLGPAGAAWATLVATFVEAGMLLWMSKGVGLYSLRKGMKWIRSILRVGVATGLQFAVEVGAFTLLTILIAAMSETDMAGHQIALCVLHFAFLPIVAFGEAGSVMVGQAVGANRDELVSKVARYTVFASVLYGSLCTLVFIVWASPIAAIFGDDSGVQDIAKQLLYLAAVFQLGDAFNITSRSILRGTGDVRYAAIVGVLVSWMALPPLTWYFGHYLELGAVGAWIGISVEVYVVAIILWWRLLRGGWKESARKSRSALIA